MPTKDTISIFKEPIVTVQVPLESLLTVQTENLTDLEFQKYLKAVTEALTLERRSRMNFGRI